MDFSSDTDYGKLAYLKTEDLTRQLSYQASKIRETSEALTRKVSCIKFSGYVDKQFSYTAPFISPTYIFEAEQEGYVTIKCAVSMYSGGTGFVTIIPYINNEEYDRRIFRTSSYSQDLNTDLYLKINAGRNEIYLKLAYGPVTIQQIVQSYEIFIIGYDLFAISDSLRLNISSNALNFQLAYNNHRAMVANIIPKDNYVFPAYTARLLDNVKECSARNFPVYNSETDTYSTTSTFLAYTNESEYAYICSFDGTSLSSVFTIANYVKAGAFEVTYTHTKYAVLLYVSSDTGNIQYRHFSLSSYGSTQTVCAATKNYVRIVGVRDTGTKVAFILTSDDLINELIISDDIPVTGLTCVIPPVLTDIGYGNRVNARWTSATTIEVIMTTKEGVVKKNIDISGEAPVITSVQNLGECDTIFNFTEGTFYIRNRSISYVANEV